MWREFEKRRSEGRGEIYGNEVTCTYGQRTLNALIDVVNSAEVRTKNIHGGAEDNGRRSMAFSLVLFFPFPRDWGGVTIRCGKGMGRLSKRECDMSERAEH